MNIGWVTGIVTKIGGSFLGMWIVLAFIAGAIGAIFGLANAAKASDTTFWMLGAGHQILKHGVAQTGVGSRAVTGTQGTSNKVNQYPGLPGLTAVPPAAQANPLPPSTNLSALTPEQKRQIQKMTPAQKQKLLRELSKP